MVLEGVDEEGLVRLHGTLIACGWIEQNTGLATSPRPGVVAQCYRCTSGGRRVVQEVAKADESIQRAA
jgi:hypothetical protein